jgi:IclR family pca regulon transcriptional regulator
MLTLVQMSNATGEYLKSLERGLSVITAFSAQTPLATISEIASKTGLSRASTRRILLTLQELGYVRSQNRLFGLTPKVLEIGSGYLSALLLPDIAAPHIRGLAARFNESSSVAILDGTDIVYVARAPTRRIMTIALNIGSRLPAYCTSMGRVLLAHLPASDLDQYLDSVALRQLTKRTITDRSRLLNALTETRSRGWALVDQELEDGVRSVAAPIRSHEEVVAALNVSAHAGRTSLEKTRSFVPELLRTADRISGELGYTASAMLTTRAPSGHEAVR